MDGSRLEPPPRGPRWHYRVAFAIVAVIALAVIVLVPITLISLKERIHHPLSAQVVTFLPSGKTHADSYSVLHLTGTALDEEQRTLTVNVTGYHVCITACSVQDTVVFFGVRGESRVAPGLPPAASLPLPKATSPIDATIRLPVAGRLLFYPFDRYRLVVGIGLEEQAPGQSAHFLAPAAAAGQLFVTAQQLMPRMQVSSAPVPATDRQPVIGDFAYLGVWALDYSRPRYLQVLVLLAVLLVAAAAIYAVVLPSLPTLLINAGGLILGVWGIRSLLLGNLPPDATIVDMILTAIIFAQLSSVTLRMLNYLHARSGLRLFPWAQSYGTPRLSSDDD